MIELMMVVGIIGILAGAAIGYSGTFRKQEILKEVTRNVVNAMAQARTEAIRKNHRTAVMMGNGVLLVFVDTNKNLGYDTGETKIYRYPTTGVFDSSVALTVSGLQTGVAAGTSLAYFDYQGFVSNGSGVPLSGVVCLKSATAGVTRSVQLTVGGAARVQSFADAVAVCP